MRGAKESKTARKNIARRTPGCLAAIFFSQFIYGAQQSKRLGVSERVTTRGLGIVVMSHILLSRYRYIETKLCDPRWQQECGK